MLKDAGVYSSLSRFSGALGRVGKSILIFIPVSCAVFLLVIGDMSPMDIGFMMDCFDWKTRTHSPQTITPTPSLKLGKR